MENWKIEAQLNHHTTRAEMTDEDFGKEVKKHFLRDAEQFDTRFNYLCICIANVGDLMGEPEQAHRFRQWIRYCILAHATMDCLLEALLYNEVSRESGERRLSWLSADVISNQSAHDARVALLDYMQALILYAGGKLPTPREMEIAEKTGLYNARCVLRAGTATGGRAGACIGACDAEGEPQTA